MSVAAIALGAWLLAPAASVAETASVMIVLDGSGSMAGQLDPKGRQSKIDLARDALRAALANAGPQTRIGLAAFGHRRGSCNDAEIVRAPAPPDVEPMMAALAQIKPRGKGPIAFALREAARQFPEDSAPRSVLLIHDGADNCQADVCAAATELAAAGIAAHVVSLGVPAEDLAKMACLPQATGGRHFKVETSEQVAAAVAEALRAAGSEPTAMGLAPAGPTSWTTTVSPPPQLPTTGPTALHLRALAAPNGEPLSVPLHWIVSHADEAKTILFDAWAANPVVPVEPGQYLVEAYGDVVSARQSVTVRDGRPVAVPIMLGAGALRVHVVAQKTNAPLADAVITVANPDGAPLAVLKGGEAQILVPAGRFRVSAELGSVRSEQTVAVAEGYPTPVDLALSVGRIQLMSLGREGGGPSDAALFVVMEDDPPRGRREVARSAASQAEFALPPGVYYAVARQGGVEARERLELGSGDVVRRTLGAPIGRLGLASSVPGSVASNAFAPHVSYSVRRIDDPDQDTVTTSQLAPTLNLPIGRYRVEARYGLTNVATTRDIEIKAGQTAQLAIEHQAATLKLRFSGPDAALADISWEVRDESGRTVWTSSQAEDAAPVLAGRYLVAADRGGRHEERSVELRAGDTKLVEVRAE
jgi:Ca-activated chloride channel family protein